MKTKIKQIIMSITPQDIENGGDRIVEEIMGVVNKNKMDLNTKEVLTDCLTLISKLFIFSVITYVVFFKGASGWWYLLYIFSYSFITSEAQNNHSNKQ